MRGNNNFIFYGLVLFISSIVIGLDLGTHSMHLWDESRQANNALEMMQSGNYLFPTYEGQPDFWNTKPHFVIVFQALSFNIFGTNMTALRLPAAIAAIFTVLLWFRFFEQRGNRNMGLLSVFILLTCGGFNTYHVARTGDYDIFLVLSISIAIQYLYAFLFEEQSGKMALRFCLFFGISIMFKSTAALLWCGIFLPLALIFSENRKNNVLLLSRYAWIPVLIVGAYYGYREMLNPGYLNAVWGNEITGRYLEANEGHHTVWYFYFDRLARQEFTYFLFVLVLPFITMPFMERKWQKHSAFFLLSAILFISIISVSKTRIEWYLAPIYPLLAVFIASGLQFRLENIKAEKALKGLYLLFCVTAGALHWNLQVEYNAQSPVVDPAKVLETSLRTGKLPHHAKWLCGTYRPYELFYGKLFSKKGMRLAFQDSFQFYSKDTVLVYYNGYFDSLNKYNYCRKIHEPDPGLPMWVFAIDSAKFHLNKN